MKPIVTAHQYIATCASAFSQSLAEAILDASASGIASWLEHVRAQFREQREDALFSIERELEVTIPPPAGAFYAFVPVPACDTVTFAKTLATDAAVLVIPGVAFGIARRRLRPHFVRRVARRDRHGNRAHRPLAARGRTMNATSPETCNGIAEDSVPFAPPP